MCAARGNHDGDLAAVGVRGPVPTSISVPTSDDDGWTHRSPSSTIIAANRGDAAVASIL